MRAHVFFSQVNYGLHYGYNAALMEAAAARGLGLTGMKEICLFYNEKGEK
jgi:hypothetical protein